MYSTKLNCEIWSSGKEKLLFTSKSYAEKSNYVIFLNSQNWFLLYFKNPAAYSIFGLSTFELARENKTRNTKCLSGLIIKKICTIRREIIETVMVGYIKAGRNGSIPNCTLFYTKTGYKVFIRQGKIQFVFDLNATWTRIAQSGRFR